VPFTPDGFGHNMAANYTNSHMIKRPTVMKTAITQTDIDTNTFIEILNINAKKHENLKSIAVQAVRY